MEQIKSKFNLARYQQPTSLANSAAPIKKTGPDAKTPEQDLINQIVAQMVVDQNRAAWLRKMMAIQTNTFKWSTTDLHAVLQKKHDPTVRNYTAWVTWRFGLAKKKRQKRDNSSASN